MKKFKRRICALIAVSMLLCSCDAVESAIEGVADFGEKVSQIGRVIGNLAKLVFTGEVNTTADNDHIEEFSNIYWYQYAMIDENGYHQCAYENENGSIQTVLEDSWWAVRFHTIDHTMEIQHTYYSRSSSSSTEMEVLLFNWGGSNKAKSGAMYEGCENTEWYYPMSYQGADREFHELNEDETFEDRYSLGSDDWMKVTLVGERLEIAWFHSGESEPRQIRYFYNSESTTLPETASATDTVEESEETEN